MSVPTSTRSFTQLLSTEAGVNTELSPVLTNGNGNQSPSVNGTRTTSTSLFFNGVDATNITTNEGSLNDNIAPAPETLQEVKLQTSLYDASTGRSGGGNFQLITKQGGNSFNGQLTITCKTKSSTRTTTFSTKKESTRPKAQAKRSGLHAWWSGHQGQILFLWQLSVHGCDYRFCADRPKHHGVAAGAGTD